MAGTKKKGDSATKKEDVQGAVIAAINKSHKGGITYASGATFLGPVRGGLPSGLPSLDLAMSRPSLPLGRAGEVQGLEGSAKTTLVYYLIAQLQRLGGIPILADTEHSFDDHWAAMNGIDLENLPVMKADKGKDHITVEDIFNRIYTALAAYDKINLKHQVPLLFIWDSIASTPTEEALVTPVGKKTYGSMPGIISAQMPILIPRLQKHKATVIFVNQLRQTYNATQYQDKWHSPGGQALQHHLSFRYRMKMGVKLKVGDILYGQGHEAKVTKNKVGPPNRIAKFDILYNGGIDYHGSLFDAFVDMGWINRDGNSYDYNGERLGEPGKLNAKNAWREHYVEHLGGFDTLYQKWQEAACSQGLLIPYTA